MGLVLEKPFPTYPNGFPPEVIAEFTRRTGIEILGN
jgi:phosphopentomutase